MASKWRDKLQVDAYDFGPDIQRLQLQPPSPLPLPRTVLWCLMAGQSYYGGILIAAGLSVYQQKLIFHREKALCFKAFLNSNWFGLAVFAGLVADYWLR